MQTSGTENQRDPEKIRERRKSLGTPQIDRKKLIETPQMDRKKPPGTPQLKRKPSLTSDMVSTIVL